MSRPAAWAAASLAVLALSLTPLAPERHANAQAAEPPADAAAPDEPETPPPPTWRFRDDSRPIKVVVLAGSIGAYRRHPYSEQIAAMCPNIEVENISQVGLGAWALRKHFEQQVLDNRHLRWNVEGQEHWLVFAGGLNSVGMPHSTNHHMRRLFELAHRRGMKIVALTLTPWGTDREKRWQGINALELYRDSHTVSDFVLGRLSPAQALGKFREKRRVDADAPWDPSEVPEIAIDLYDSPLRDRNAPLRDLDEMRELLSKDSRWQKAHAELDELQRAAKLEADAQEMAQIPRWYMRPELHAFDHIHPNAEGHRLIAETMCPSMPASWGCECPAPSDESPAAVAPAEGGAP